MAKVLLATCIFVQKLEYFFGHNTNSKLLVPTPNEQFEKKFPLRFFFNSFKSLFNETLLIKTKWQVENPRISAGDSPFFYFQILMIKKLNHFLICFSSLVFVLFQFYFLSCYLGKLVSLWCVLYYIPGKVWVGWLCELVRFIFTITVLSVFQWWRCNGIIRSNWKRIIKEKCALYYGKWIFFINSQTKRKKTSSQYILSFINELVVQHNHQCDVLNTPAQNFDMKSLNFDTPIEQFIIQY